MANEYTTMYDILVKPLAERREQYEAKQIEYIEIDGNKFGGYKTFSSYWEKTYVKQPERSASGVIDNLNSYATFTTFHLKVNFAMMAIDDYRRLYGLMLDRNEFVVTAYDVVGNEPYTCKMYFAPDQMPKLYAMARRLNGEKFIEVLGIQDYTIELIGTNATLQKVDILFHDIYGNLIANATKSVSAGVPTILNYDYIAPTGYRFEGEWKDRIETVYRNGEVITPLKNISLYAVAKPTNEYTLSLDYGVGIKPTTQSTEKQIDSFPITYEQTISTAISNASVVLADGSIFSFPSNGTGAKNVKYNGKEYLGESAYQFSGWYLETTANEGVKVTGNTSYKFKNNITIHQIYEPKSYNITFDTKAENISFSSTTAKYSDKVNLPSLNISGKTFKGWYFDDNGEEVKFNGTMPPFNLNLYAKWE